MAQAVGMIEVFGLTAAFVAGDAGCKAANVTMETFDKNKPANADELPVPLIVMVKFRGSVEDVRAAVEAAEEAANALTGVISRHIIANPEADTEKMLKLSGLDKGKKKQKKEAASEDEADVKTEETNADMTDELTDEQIKEY